MPAPIDYADIQGILRFGFGALSESSFFLLEITDVAAARAWLGSVPITRAVELDAPHVVFRI